VAGVWVAMAVSGLLTFLVRMSFIGLLGKWQPSPLAQRALRYVPPAVLAAIIVPEVLVREGQLDPLNPRLAAALLAAVVARLTRSALLAIMAGMAALLSMQALGL
jgi:branched-subunit amino acid transport protein